MKIVFESRLERLAYIGGTVALVAAIALFLVQREKNLNYEVTKFKLMSVHDRVVNVVTSWANAPSHPADNAQLEVVWSTSRHDLPYYPEAAQLLEQQMKSEFRESSSPVMSYRDLKDSTKNPGGSVSTVAELARLVRLNYQPQ